MLKKLLPILLALVGLAGGIGAGLFLRPAPAAEDHTSSGTEHEKTAEAGHADESGAADHDPDEAEHDEGGPEYVKMNNQFVVPVVESKRVAAMVVLALSVEVSAGNTEAVYQREPKLRDAFLQVLFDHANTGGFSGSFTDGSNLVVLRNSLREAAVMVMGDVVSDILITDIARQDN